MAVQEFLEASRLLEALCFSRLFCVQVHGSDAEPILDDAQVQSLFGPGKVKVGTGDERVITLLSKYFKYLNDNPPDWPDKDWRGVRAMENIVTAIWLYNRTGDEMILDIGPETAARFSEIVAGAGTVIWNGPVGVFEFEHFGAGTKALAEAIAASDAFSVAGGGDTLAAIDKYGVADRISYISTGGGAFLEFVEGKKLPAVEVLERRAAG